MSTSYDGPAARSIELLSELVSINSVNPEHAGERSGPGGEQELAEWLADHSERLGGSVVLDEVHPGRPNIYAMFEGTGDAVIAVDVHLDTVGVEHMHGDPFDGRVEDGKVYGRGTADTKATFAVVLSLLEDVAAGRFSLGPSVMLVGTVGEEAGGFSGAHRFNDWLVETDQRLDQIVVAEPTLCAPVHGHKGGLGLEITVHGHAAHSSKPHLGANAINGAAAIVAAYVAEQDRLANGPASTAMGPGTLSVNEIEGGLARNIIPDRCTLYAGRRTAPGEDPDALFEQLSAMAREAAAPLDVSIELANGSSSAAFYTDPSTELVTTLSGLSERAPEVATYGTNALVYGDVEAEMVVFGPGSIDQAHQAVEWIDVSEMERADLVYRKWLGRTR